MQTWEERAFIDALRGWFEASPKAVKHCSCGRARVCSMCEQAECTHSRTHICTVCDRAANDGQTTMFEAIEEATQIRYTTSGSIKYFDIDAYLRSHGLRD